MWVCAESDGDFYESPGPFFKLEKKDESLWLCFSSGDILSILSPFFNPLPPTYDSLGVNFFCSVISEFHSFFLLGFWKAYSYHTVISDCQISTVSRQCYGILFSLLDPVPKIMQALIHGNMCYRSESYRSVNALNSSWPSFELRSYTEERVLTIRNANNWLP